MKGLLLFILFLLIVPLLIGRLAGLYSKSKSDLVQLATTAGLLILFTFYLLFIEKKSPEKETTERRNLSGTEQPVNCTLNCIRDDYSVYIQERGEQQTGSYEEQYCVPTREHRPSY
ncbi:MAG: hypothetical protein D3906_09520 [Candidatus Electrothrix sp. AUS1_2]|nr:hypothetical protein [Candidatus Electrothrix sp. AUS1_2]